MLLTIREVAAKMQVSERMVWALVQTGKLRSVTIGRCRRIDPKDLERYVEAQKGVKQ